MTLLSWTPRCFPANKGVSQETSDAADSESSDGELTEQERKNRANVLLQLTKKMTRADGKPVTIGILTPVDYTTLEYAGVAEQSIMKAMQALGDFPIEKIGESLSALTLEEFRRVVIKTKVDIVMVAVIKPTNLDFFLFDRRDPYSIVAISEILPEEVQYQVTAEIVESYARVLTRKTLYAYLQNQIYELPRRENSPLLRAEVPRWIASQETLRLVNRELISQFYVSAGVGAALSVGSGSSWNSNLITLQIGRRIFDQYYLEVSADLSAYNTFGASAKYMFMSPESPARFAIGLGAAIGSNVHSLSFDPMFTQGSGALYVVPSGAFIFPIGDVHFKVESRIYIGTQGGFMFTMAPELAVLF